MHAEEQENRRSPYHIFKDCQVTDVTTLEEFLLKYYKHERYLGRGEEYAAVVLASHRADYEEYGMDWMGPFESITGSAVSFYRNEG